MLNTPAMPSLSACVPTQYALNIVSALQELKIVGAGSEEDAMGVMENSRKFFAGFRGEGEGRLQALKRFDDKVTAGLMTPEIPRACRMLVTPSFFERGATDEKIKRYLELTLQYARACPDLVEVRDVLASYEKDLPGRITSAVQRAQNLSAMGLGFPSMDLFAVGIGDALRYAQERSVNRRSFADGLATDLRLLLGVLEAIKGAELSFEQSSVLFFSLFAISAQWPAIAQGVITGGLMMALSERGVIDEDLIAKDPASLFRIAQKFNIPDTTALGGLGDEVDAAIDALQANSGVRKTGAI